MLGREICLRLEKIAECSEPGPGVTRLPFTSQHKKALKLLRKWMIQAGLDVHLDHAGTLVGRKRGTGICKTLCLGSHQDSVPQGGRYDGILGVVLPIVVLEQFLEHEFPFNIEILAFADEEGVRFPTALLGPRALAGSFDKSVLHLKDRAGETLHEAMTGFDLDPGCIPELKRNPEDIIGYIETHIEQGPVLENLDQPVGLVSAICGIERWQYRLNGQAAHAGTTPMELRKDALAAAAIIITRVEKICTDRPNLIGTVGELNVVPNAVNAVPGEVQFQIELRSELDQSRIEAGETFKIFAEQIATDRNLQLTCRKTYEQPAVKCNDALISNLTEAAKEIGMDLPVLPSGATHDASAMSDLCPIAMLFVQCRNGISHNPLEFAREEHIDHAARLLTGFLANMQN